MIFFDQTYTVTRKSAGHVDAANGNAWVDGAPSNLSLALNIQRVTGKRIEFLPEGRRDRENISGFSDVQLYTSETSPSTNPDIISFDGANYEVYECKGHHSLLPHYTFLASKVRAT